MPKGTIMSIVEIGDDGGLYLPAQPPAEEKPHSEFVLDVHNGLIVLRPADDPEPIWKNPNPAKRVESFLRWAETPRPPAPDIPLEFLDREHIYD
jgi:hypothetical protein